MDSKDNEKKINGYKLKNGVRDSYVPIIRPELSNCQEKVALEINI